MKKKELLELAAEAIRNAGIEASKVLSVKVENEGQLGKTYIVRCEEDLELTFDEDWEIIEDW